MKYYLIQSKPDNYNNRNVTVIASKKPIHKYVYSAKEIDKHEFYIFGKYFDEIVENEIEIDLINEIDNLLKEALNET